MEMTYVSMFNNMTAL